MKVIDSIKKWFAAKGGASHILAGSFVFLMGAYGVVPPFHSLVLQIHQMMPGWAQESVTTGLALWAFYKTWKAKSNPAPPAQN